MMKSDIILFNFLCFTLAGFFVDGFRLVFHSNIQHHHHLTSSTISTTAGRLLNSPNSHSSTSFASLRNRFFHSRTITITSRVNANNHNRDDDTVDNSRQDGVVQFHPMVKEVSQKKMTANDVMRAICGSRNLSHTSPSLLIPGLSMEPLNRPHLTTRFLIPNPYQFLKHPELSKLYGLDFHYLRKSVTMRELGYYLPVIYLADELKDFGTLGLAINRKATTSMMDIYPTLRKLRDRPVYQGGALKRGNSFSMVHRIAGFPENRPWKGLPNDREFKLFFSPDIAMANELCVTNDAQPSNFKFFEYATIWSPGQLELEMKKHSLWYMVKGPVSLFFDDDPAAIDVDDPIANTSVPSLFERIVWSLPSRKTPSSSSGYSFRLIRMMWWIVSYAVFTIGNVLLLTNIK